MFNKGVVDKIIDRLEGLTDTINDFIVNIKHYIDKKIDGVPIIDNQRIKDEIMIEVNKQLNIFHKEIADKYFESLANFIRWNKEISLVSLLQGKTGDIELGKVKQELMKPYLDEKYKEDRANQTEKINQLLQTKGEEIRKLKDEKYNEYIKLQREGREFNTIKAQYDILQLLFGEVK